MKVINYAELKSLDGNCGKVKESFSDNIALARVEMKKGISTAHYHNKTTEYYVIISGNGLLKVKSPSGKLSDVNLETGTVVRVDIGEIHQTNNLDSLVIEAITIPAWTFEDEIESKENLF